MRIHGPYDRGYGRKRWRVVLVTRGSDGRPKQRAYSFATEAEARREIDRAVAAASDVTVGSAVRDFLAEHRAGWADVTHETSRYRLESLLRLTEGDRPLRHLTARAARQLYGQRVGEVKVDTHRSELAVALRWADWCCDRGWLRAGNPFADVEPVGRKRRGKRQLRIDEARAFLRAALAEVTPAGTCCAAALLLGLRASEATSRAVRDLDDRGRVLWIPCSKTPAGVRSLGVPDVLRAPLLVLAEGRPPGAPLFGPDANRKWLWRAVRRICAAIKVDPVCVHSLRGLHATLATINRVPAETVARALGHTSADVTLQHYAAPGSQDSARADDVVELLTE